MGVVFLVGSWIFIFVLFLFICLVFKEYLYWVRVLLGVCIIFAD